ncbi:hypothetical protein H6B16_002790 [Caecibacteroides pullorum]|nr:hypothetical protein [Caecibacteroides pullorum]
MENLSEKILFYFGKHCFAGRKAPFCGEEKHHFAGEETPPLFQQTFFCPKNSENTKRYKVFNIQQSTVNSSTVSQNELRPEKKKVLNILILYIIYNIYYI